MKSVFEQTYKNIEYIIIDGVSTDGSFEVIKKYLNDIDYFVCEQDAGLYDAINKGISLSTGDLIGMVNADDILLPNATEILVDSILQGFKVREYPTTLRVRTFGSSNMKLIKEIRDNFFYITKLIHNRI